MTNINFVFVPESVLKLVAQTYIQPKKPGEHRELFAKWVHKMQATEPGHVTNEFAQLQRTIHDHGNTIEIWRRHADYNRYNDMVCFDQTRVILNDGLDNDYIHANYVDGYQRKRSYILTQGPLENTVCDLWRMVWQEKVATIVMVTRLVERSKPKCARYFPLSNDVDFQSGVFRISLIKKEERAKCTASFLRVLNLITNEQRYVVHVWYTLWPDQGIPQDVTALRQFLNYVKLLNINLSHLYYQTPQQHQRGPTIIYHCSAGIGRSAVMVILDIFSEALLHNEFIDPLELALKVRKERYHAIQTKIQLLFIYEYVLSLAAVPRMNLVQQA